jgi:hypothetical protein
MNSQALIDIARTLVGYGRRLLANDESTTTGNKRFANNRAALRGEFTAEMDGA